ncbi:prepilin peptidase dependent protein B [Paramixta manurensis]|uniref:Prepilin peptidase dependent protein B n=1 Tax=Paramixta manurensis TaxID=2740817 RepID=A0A6M8UCS5_9GAMM|nr:prepilin peptidase dependent protein B [Erwiniaceae bacterium PD-1]
MSVNIRGFSLAEMLIALAVSSILLAGAARILPFLQRQTLQLIADVQLQEALQQLIMVLEKAVRRAGYCNGECQGEPLQIGGQQGSCLLVKWDENSNGKWEGRGRENSEFYGYRRRERSLEMQRGVDSCEGSGWEHLSDPSTLAISGLTFARSGAQIKIRLEGYAVAFPQRKRVVEAWVSGMNLP